MIERKLTPDTNDIFFENGNVVYVSGIDQIVQNIKVRLDFYLGEYFLDITVGFPWFEQVLRKNVNLDQIENRLKQEILATEGVDYIETFDMSLDRRNRRLHVEFTAATILGSTELIEFEMGITDV
jgi:hypothetical protein